MKTETSAVDIDRNKGNFSYDVTHAYDAGTGLSEKTIHYISDVKEDPDWVREFRLKALKTFLEKPMPTHWASKDLEAIDFDKIRYYLSGGTQAKRTWEEVPEDVKRTFERLGIPKKERRFLPGVEAKPPLQGHFPINAENFGQFERTLIICDEGSELTYMEGCTAPKFNTATLHSAVVELVALKGAKLQYITVQNWSENVFNLV